MNNDTTMKLDMLHEAIGLIDFDLIEESEEAPAQAKPARVAAFAKKPWMKWVAAAAAIVVFAVGTPIALNMMGAFGGGNYVAPSGGNSGVVTPIDGSEPESGSGQSSEEASSSSEGEKPAHGDSSEHADSGCENPPVIESESAPGSSGQEPASGSSETQDEPGTGGEPDSEGPTSGEFIKDNMPAVTYRINGEYKTFDYQSSTAVVDSGSSYVIDRYVGSDGSTVSVDALSGGLMRYDSSVNQNQSHFANVISKKKAVEIAKSVVADTDIAMDVLENADISDYFLSGKRYITFAVEEGKVEVCLDKKGGLCCLIISKNNL